MKLDEFAGKTNAYLTDYIKFADAKAGAALTITTIIGAVVSLTARQVLVVARTYSASDGSVTHSAVSQAVVVIGVLSAAVAAVTITLTLWHTVDALRPRKGTAEASVNSFPDIALHDSSSAYVDAVKRLSEEVVLSEYAKHNYRLAKVASSKFDAIDRALYVLRISLLSAFALGLVYACLPV